MNNIHIIHSIFLMLRSHGGRLSIGWQRPAITVHHTIKGLLFYFYWLDTLKQRKLKFTDVCIFRHKDVIYLDTPHIVKRLAAVQRPQTKTAHSYIGNTKQTSQYTFLTFTKI